MVVLIPMVLIAKGGGRVLTRGEFSEKRGFNRMDVECRMTFTVNGDATTHTAIARDLSATGLLIATNQDIPVGTRLNVCVTPEQALVPPLEALVEVMRVISPEPGRFELGVMIKEIKPSA